MIFTKEILGIYFSEDAFEVVKLKRIGGVWETDEAFSPEIISGLPLAERLRAILQTIRPSRTRKLILGLPRNSFFLRELSYPQLEKDEAVKAVRLGIGMHSHLDAKDIIFDATAFKRAGKTTVLLAYIPKVYLEPFFKAIKDTGHWKSFAAASPAFLGIDFLLRKIKADFPCVSLGKQRNACVVSLHGSECWEGSHLVSPAGSNHATYKGDSKGDILSELETLSASLPGGYHTLISASRLSEAWGVEMGEGFRNICNFSKETSSFCKRKGGITWGICSAIIGLSPYPAISFQETRRKKPISVRVRPFQALAALMLLFMIIATLFMGIGLRNEYKNLSALSKEKESLEKTLAPIVNIKRDVAEIHKKIAEIEEFRSGNPQILSILFELAQHTPKDTWIRSFNYKNERLVLSVESDSAVQAMEAWRKSDTLLRLKMTTPVRKYRNNKERFSVEITFGKGAIKERGKSEHESS